MATQMFSANVYLINGTPIAKNTDSQSMAFPVSNCIFRPAPSGTVSSVSGADLYGIVQVNASGLQTGNAQYYTVETVAQLKALANA